MAGHLQPSHRTRRGRHPAHWPTPLRSIGQCAGFAGDRGIYRQSVTPALKAHKNTSYLYMNNGYYTWENADMNISAATKTGSMASDYIIYEKNKNKTDYIIKWAMTSWSEFEFIGQLADGLIEPK